jgi:hypothetical protein
MGPRAPDLMTVIACNFKPNRKIRITITTKINRKMKSKSKTNQSLAWA